MSKYNEAYGDKLSKLRFGVWLLPRVAKILTPGFLVYYTAIVEEVLIKI